MNVRPAVTFTCVGPSTIAILGATALGAGVLGVVLSPFAFIGALVPIVLVFFAGSTTIVVSDEAVELSFAHGFTRTRIPLAAVATCDATRYHGWSRGYRVSPGVRKWLVRGGPAVSIVAGGTRYLASADSPENVCEEIRRRQALTLSMSR